MIQNNIRSAFETVVDFENWKPIRTNARGKLDSHELRASLVRNDKNSQNPRLTLTFGTDILNILKVNKQECRIDLLQNPNNPRHFLLVKAAEGFKISWANKYVGRIIFNYKNPPCKDFNAKSIEYSIHPNNTISFYL